MTKAKRHAARNGRFSFDPGFLVVLAIALAAIWPFVSRASLPQGTDAELHIFRLHELTLLIQGGEWYPRWAPNFYHGYGYPIFNYYAPLSYYLGLPLTLWPMFDAVDGVKFVFVLGLLLAGVGMYGFVRDNWGRPAGYVAAAVYLYAPYVQYIDPHARGVLAESLSLGLFPVALWAVDRVRRGGGAGAWATAVFTTAAVILSHNLMGLLFFGVLFAWACWVTAVYRGQRATRVGAVFAALGLGLGAAAFFWLPVFLERNAVNLNTLIGQGDNFDFRTHFLSLREMLAFSLRLDWGATEPAFRFNLGVAQWLLGGLGVALLLARQAAGRATRRASHAAFFAAGLFVLLFLMLPVSEPVWEVTPVLPFFQFPWRLLGAAAAMLAVLAGVGTAAVVENGRFARVVLPLFVALPMLLGLPLSQPAPWPDFGEVNTLRMSLIEHEGRWLGTTSTSDYLPATVDVTPQRNGNVVAGFYEGAPPDRVNRATLPQEASVTAEQIRPLHTRYFVNTPRDMRLRLFQFDFPGWRATVDGQPAQTELGRPEGFLIVRVPAGEHVVDVRFGTTPARTAAAVVTGLAVMLTAVGAVWLGRRKSLIVDGQRPIANGETRFGIDDLRLRIDDLRLRIDDLRFGIDDLRLTIDDLRLTWLDVMAGAAAVAVFVLLLAAQPGGWLRYDSRGFVAQPAQVDLFADFGEQIALIGYDTSVGETAVAGQTFDVTLYWQAQTELPINYQAFVHVLRPDGALATQSHKLNPGDFPTRRWPADKYVRDVHYLRLPPDLPPGRYTVAAGLWVQNEGWRLPLLNAAGAQVGDSQQLFVIEVR